MGTSGAYTGSGGAWNGARRELDDLLSGGGATADDVLAPAAGAIEWDDDSGGESDTQSSEIPLRGSGVTPIRIRTRGGAGGGGGGVGIRRGAGGARTGGARG